MKLDDKTLEDIESQIQSLPPRQLEQLRSDFFFNLASVVYAMSQHMSHDNDPILSPNLVIQQAEQAVIQAFNRFFSKSITH